MRKTVSLAMTTYNGEKYLREQLDSIYNQTMIPDEVIVCDDNSKDGTIDILEEYRKAKGLKYYVNIPGLGVNKNFNKAILLCSGNYIAISDQDDIWLPNKIRTLYDYMLKIENQYGENVPILVSSDSTRFSDPSTVCLETKPIHGIITGYRNFLFNSNLYCQGCTVMMNKELVKTLPPFPSSFNEFPYDVFISMIATITGERCHICQSLMYYRNHNSNILGKKEKISFFVRLRNKLGWLTYSLFGIPFSRQKHYSELIKDNKIQISNPEIFGIIQFISEYVNSNNVFRKIQLLIKSKRVGVRLKLSQLIVLIITSPIRLFIKP